MEITKGSAKQIAWANDLKPKMLKLADDVHYQLNVIEESKFTRDEVGDLVGKVTRDDLCAAGRAGIVAIIESHDDAEWFIEHHQGYCYVSIPGCAVGAHAYSQERQVIERNDIDRVTMRTAALHYLRAKK